MMLNMVPTLAPCNTSMMDIKLFAPGVIYYYKFLIYLENWDPALSMLGKVISNKVMAAYYQWYQ